MEKPLMLGIGELLWDVFPSGKKLGGATANFAWHVIQLGGRGGLISAVGNDPSGNEIVEQLQKSGMDTSQIARLDHFPTGRVDVNLDKHGVPSYQIHTGVAWDNIQLSPSVEQVLSEASALCYGSLAQRSEKSFKTIQSALDVVPKNCLKIFDINLRQNFFTKEVIENSLKKADVLKMNEEELPVIANLFGLPGLEEERLKQLLTVFSLKCIALTKGGEGSLLITPNGESSIRSPKVEIADTVGAGDSFTAALAVGMVKGWSLQNIHQKAVEVSAYVCTQNGAMPELPNSIVSDFISD